MAKLSVSSVVKHSDELWKMVRWGNSDPVCVCGCKNLYKLGDGRYKCKDCGKVFSDKSGTILHKSKVSKELWLVAIYEFAINPECSALSLKRTLGVNYRTAYMMLQKIRFLVGKSEIKLEGIVQCDEAYIGAEWGNVHLKKKMGYMKENGYLVNGRYTKTSLLKAVSAKKYHILSLVDEKGNTRLIHTPNPITKETILAVLSDPKYKITKLVTDESKLYYNLGIEVVSSNHSKHTFVTKEGYTSNSCENRFSWFKRKWNGVFTHTSEKYLQLYLNQRQWNMNHSGCSDEDRFTELLTLCTRYTVSNRDIYNFNYKANFPKSKREIEQELADKLINKLGYVRSIEGKYKTYR